MKIVFCKVEKHQNCFQRPLYHIYPNQTFEYLIYPLLIIVTNNLKVQLQSSWQNLVTSGNVDLELLECYKNILPTSLPSPEFKFLISAWKGTKLSVQVQYTKHDETTKMPVELLLYILLMANFHQVVDSFKVVQIVSR